MPLAFGFHGQTYDDAVPLYVVLGNNRVFNRVLFQILDEASLRKEMLVEGYVAPNSEIGHAPDWLTTHIGPRSSWVIIWTAPTVTPVTGLPITGDATGTQKVTLDIAFHGQDIPVGGKTATVVYNIGAVDVTLPVALTAGMTPTQAVAAIATAINGVTGLGAVKGIGTSITVTPDDTIVLSKLTLAIA